MDEINKNRYIILDIWRLLSCLIIVWFHQYHLGALEPQYFSAGWTYVEFFFFTSGYFAYAHFKNKKFSKENGYKDCWTYVYRRFVALFPYIFITVFLKCFMNYIKEKNRITRFLRALLECLLLTRGDSNNGVIWYLQAMFVVLPLFCILAYRLPKEINLMISLLFVIIYGNFSSWGGITTFPLHLIRAYAGMSVGSIIYCISEYLKTLKFTLSGRWLLTLIEESCLIIAAGLNCFNKGNPEIYVFLYIIGLIMIFSGQTYTTRKGIINRSNIGIILRNYSSFIYLSQFVIADGLYIFLGDLKKEILMLLYFIGCFIMSTSFLIYEMKWREIINIKLKRIVLIE